MQFQENLALFDKMMRAEDLPEVAIETFKHYYELLFRGGTGLIPESEIEAVQDVPQSGDLGDEFRRSGLSVIHNAVLVKLNGGLGTSMGMEKAKSLLHVKDNLTFLDVIARHAIHVGVPLVLMNSFATQADSLAALKDYPELKNSGFDIDFLQHKFPKVLVETLQPVSQPDHPELSWNPPGHGDLYTALVTSGFLENLLSAGFEFAFVSNGDNLGATLDTRLLGYFASRRIPFLMEVAARTPADRKGGHLALSRSGGLLLRESAQCPEGDLDAFQDIARHKFFNTNNLWLHLPSLAKKLEEKGNILGLPLIRNKKTLDPRDPSSPAVYQLETAMGSAISVFEGAEAICVPRTRFSPVKTTNDLLAVRSDAYKLLDDYHISPVKAVPPSVELDPAYFRLIDELDERFPQGPPSLIDCTRLSIHGDVMFGKQVRAVGDVEIRNPAGGQLVIPDNSLLTGE